MLDIFLARIELYATLIRHGDYPVIGLKNLGLFKATEKLFNQLPKDHPLRKKYDPVNISEGIAQAAKYYLDVECAFYLYRARETA